MKSIQMQEERGAKLAKEASERGTCLRANVGTVLMKYGKIVGSGWNTSPPNMPTCEEEETCLLNEEGRCIRTVHSEMNAIFTAHPADLKGATLYCTHTPCENCMKHIVQVGITEVVYIKDYPNKYNHYFTKGITVRQYKG